MPDRRGVDKEGDPPEEHPGPVGTPSSAWTPGRCRKPHGPRRTSRGKQTLRNACLTCDGFLTMIEFLDQYRDQPASSDRSSRGYRGLPLQQTAPHPTSG
jgi:hypothetical protein